MATLLIVSLLGALGYVVYQLRANRNWAQEQMDWVKKELLWEAEIGSGSFCTTFKVQCKRSRHHNVETFAVKRMELVSPVLRKRAEHLLLNELYVLAQKSQHQYIIELVGVVLHDPAQPTTVSLIMEFSPLGTLRNLLDVSPHTVTGCPETQLRIAGNVASAMSHLHSVGIRHEDLRSSNVVLFGQAKRVAQAKVTDVGLQPLRSLLNATHEARLEAYMPPEGFDGRYVLASDVFSYGLMLWEVLTAGYPWSDKSKHTRNEVRSAICHGQRPPLSIEQRNCFLGRRAESCWAPRPDARPTFDTLCTLFMAETAPLLEMQPPLTAGANAEPAIITAISEMVHNGTRGSEVRAVRTLTAESDGGAERLPTPDSAVAGSARSPGTRSRLGATIVSRQRARIATGPACAGTNSHISANTGADASTEPIAAAGESNAFNSGTLAVSANTDAGLQLTPSSPVAAAPTNLPSTMDESTSARGDAIPARSRTIASEYGRRFSALTSRMRTMGGAWPTANRRAAAEPSAARERSVRHLIASSSRHIGRALPRRDQLQLTLPTAAKQALVTTLKRTAGLTLAVILVPCYIVGRLLRQLLLRLIAHPIFYVAFFALYASYVGAFVVQSGNPTAIFTTASSEVAFGAQIGLLTPANATGGSPWLPDGKTCLPLPQYYSLHDDDTQRRNIPIVYGLMHGALLSLTLMPLTLCHALWSKLVGRYSWLRRWYALPVDDFPYVHQLLGYFAIGGVAIGASVWLSTMVPACARSYYDDIPGACDAFKLGPKYDPFRNVVVLRLMIAPLWGALMPLMALANARWQPFVERAQRQPNVERVIMQVCALLTFPTFGLLSRTFLPPTALLPTHPDFLLIDTPSACSMLATRGSSGSSALAWPSARPSSSGHGRHGRRGCWASSWGAAPAPGWCSRPRPSSTGTRSATGATRLLAT